MVAAEVPLAEMLTYAPDLTSMTGGRGDYHMELLRYDEVPAHLTAKIVDQAARRTRKKRRRGESNPSSFPRKAGHFVARRR